jgi:hypothetical protein
LESACFSNSTTTSFLSSYSNNSFVIPFAESLYRLISSFKDFCVMQQPHLGKMVSPAIETATGTSSLQGIAAETTKQQAVIS